MPRVKVKVPKVTDGATYRGGCKHYPDGRIVRAMGRRTFTASNGFTIYTATLWMDNTRSCDCPGWVFHGRCKHLSQVGAFDQAAFQAPEMQVQAETEQRQAPGRRRIELS